MRADLNETRGICLEFASDTGRAFNEQDMGEYLARYHKDGIGKSADTGSNSSEHVVSDAGSEEDLDVDSASRSSARRVATPVRNTVDQLCASNKGSATDANGKKLKTMKDFHGCHWHYAVLP